MQETFIIWESFQRQGLQSLRHVSCKSKHSLLAVEIADSAPTVLRGRGLQQRTLQRSVPFFQLCTLTEDVDTYNSVSRCKAL